MTSTRPASSIIVSFVLVAACAAELDMDLVEEEEEPPPRITSIIAPACGDAKLSEIRAPATASNPAVLVDCSVTLAGDELITKRLVFRGSAASGVNFDCNDARISVGAINTKDIVEVASRKVTGPDNVVTWDRPEDVAIRRCRITGGVRIQGLGKNGEAEDVKLSSHLPGHTQRARDAAPRGTILEDVHITGSGQIPLYLSPGVSYTQLIDSVLDGTTTGVALYLDAESYRNTIKNNTIRTDTETRELVAIDGSSFNTIINNDFSSLDHGGIFLYRNCGEGGTVRHATPSSNTIVNNIFYYNTYNGDQPSVYLGSRDGNRNYCGLDDGYPFGSSVSNLDHARYNIVMQNQIYRLPVSQMIRTQNPTVNSPNYIGHNQTVTSAVARRAGCFQNSFIDFIADGVITEFLGGTAGSPTCTLRRCDDGVLSSVGTCSFSTIDYTCQITDNNAGCQGPVTCPSGRRVIGVTAACDLELGTVDPSVLAGIPTNYLHVTDPSDNVAEGRCFAGSTTISSGSAVTRGSSSGTVTVGCSERDANGGDCFMRGRVYCR